LKFWIKPPHHVKVFQSSGGFLLFVIKMVTPGVDHQALPCYQTMGGRTQSTVIRNPVGRAAIHDHQFPHGKQATRSYPNTGFRQRTLLAGISNLLWCSGFNLYKQQGLSTQAAKEIICSNLILANLARWGSSTILHTFAKDIHAPPNV